MPTISNDAMAQHRDMQKLIGVFEKTNKLLEKSIRIWNQQANSTKIDIEQSISKPENTISAIPDLLYEYRNLLSNYYADAELLIDERFRLESITIDEDPNVNAKKIAIRNFIETLAAFCRYYCDLEKAYSCE